MRRLFPKMATWRSSAVLVLLQILSLHLQIKAVQFDPDSIRSLADSLDQNLESYVVQASGYGRVRELYNENAGDFTYATVEGLDLVNTMSQGITTVLNKKMHALQESVKWAEELAVNYTWNNNLKIDDVDYVAAKTINESDGDYKYNPQFKQKVNFNTSSVHIPVEIYEGDINILNGLEWSNRLDEQWRRNKENDSDLLWQYFGSQEGIMRNYPASKWRGTGIDLYDVRRRPWYTQGASSPKDMLIMVDTSGSTHGQALALMQHAVKSILETLGDNDFVNVAQFSKEAKLVGCFDNFVQANYRNKEVLADYVQQLQANEMAHYTTGLTFAFEQFLKLDNATAMDDNGQSANCNRIIMFLTDGGTEMPTEVFEKYNWPEKKIRIFTYAIGPTANPVAAVKWIACSNRGYFARIPAMGAIRSTVQVLVSM